MPVGKISESASSCQSDAHARTQILSYFILTVLGFSFWFFMAVPFASHRETYGWLAGVLIRNFAEQFSFGLSSTYRPLSQVVTWSAFLFLDPRDFPTNVLRQALLQGLVYGMFVLAWWLIYSGAAQRRTTAVVGGVAGGVFFSGYVHLFHIYGLFYVPVMLTLGILLRFHASNTLRKREVWLGIVAAVLALWHPYATGLFVGFFFGFYVDTFWERSRAQHIQAVGILLLGIILITSVVFLFPRERIALDTRLFGFLVSYQTNEVHWIGSLAAFLLTQMVVLSMGLSRKLQTAICILVSALGVFFFVYSLPLLLLWPCAVLVKLYRLRRWSLFFLTLAATLLPFGGALGTPIYALFAIILAVYVTPLGWPQAEKVLAFFTPRHVMCITITAMVVILMVRAGIDVPIMTSVAKPLLTERERTYQLESVLAWLHTSEYCNYEIAFAENAGSPIDDVESAITRRTRPPSALADVRRFWNTALVCKGTERPRDASGTATITFGGPALTNSRPVYAIQGRYAGMATVWIKAAQE